MIRVSELKITWGDKNIQDMFNIISTSDIPSEKPFTYRLEMMPNGKSRSIATSNNDNVFSVTVSRDGAKKSFQELEALFNEEKIDRLSIVSLVDGEVLASFKKARLTKFKKLGAVSDGQANDVIIEWSCINEM
jgi:hypothetical protein